MQEKDMVNDTLSMVNNSLTNYASIISQCSNQELRGALQQIRNSCEQFQFKMYQTATQKGFYQPAAQANDNEVQQIKNMFS